jgi:serine/threonine protein phosphatase 1
MKKWKGWFSRGGAAKPQRPNRRRIDLGSAPPQFPIYAIGDVHGCLDQLMDAENRIAGDMNTTQRTGLVVLLGDLVDRGPNSRQVIEHLVTPSPLGLRRLALCGNHDDLFSRVLETPSLLPHFLKLGGEQTLLSYGIDVHYLMSRRKPRLAAISNLLAESVPQSHRDFLRNLPVSLRVGELLFVHAGIMPGLPIEEQSDNDMMWVREPFISEGPKLQIMVVHGHTPTANPDFGLNRIGIDTGAYQTGRLTVLKIVDGRALII